MAYGRVLAVAAAKAFDADDIMQFSDAAKIAICGRAQFCMTTL